MALSWNEIRNRAINFSKEWESESKEHAESQSFWNDFFNIFGISRKRVASFEEPVKKLGDKRGRIDLFWRGAKNGANRTPMTQKREIILVQRIKKKIECIRHREQKEFIG